MSTPTQADNIWARLKAALPGVPVPNAYLLLDDAGLSGIVPTKPGTQYFVRPQDGDDGNDGKSWADAFASMTPLDSIIANYDTINLAGVLKQQWQPPINIFDVTINGYGNTPRQATESGSPTGGGATWLAPDSPAAGEPLLHLREQSWIVNNIFFSGPSDAACILLDRQEVSAAQDASHFASYSCVYGGGLYGIEDSGGANNLRLIGNKFQNFTGASDYAIRNTSAAIALPLEWLVIANIFRNNTNHLVAPLSGASIRENDFGVIGSSLTTTIALSLTGGKNNSVFRNMFNRPLDTAPNATLYVGGTDDVWSQNYGSDGLFYGVPDNA